LLRYLGRNLSAEPDAGQGTEQQAAEQGPVDTAQHPVAEAGNQGQRHGVGDIRSDNFHRRKFWVEEKENGNTQRASADRGNGDEHTENRANGDRDLAEVALAQFGIIMFARVIAQLAAKQDGNGGE